jgi:hypothetical protein
MNTIFESSQYQALLGYDSKTDLISKDLTRVSETRGLSVLKDKLRSVFSLTNVKHWFAGTYSAAATARAIDQLVRDVGAACDRNQELARQNHAGLKKLQENISVLNEKFNRKGVKLLQSSVDTLHKLVQQSGRPPLPPKSTRIVTTQPPAPRPSKDERISSLNLDSPTFKQDVLNILTTLEQQPTAHNEQRALQKLIDPETFKPSAGELVVLEKLPMIPLGSRSKTYEDANWRSIALEAKRSLLRHLQTSGTDLLQKYRELQENARKQRVLSLGVTGEPQASNVALLLGAADRVVQQLEKEYQKTVEEKYGTLSPLMEHYPTLDLRRQIPDFASLFFDAVDEQFLKHKIPHFKLPTETFKSKLEACVPFIEAQRQQLAANHIAFHEEAYYAWLSSNERHIVKPYSQADDEDRNLGGGTCYQNALDRQKMLQREPAVSASKIPMGSTMDGRFAQLRLFRAGASGNLEECDRLEQGAIAERGLKLTENRLQATHGKEAVEQLISVAKNDADPFILSMWPEEGAGHAINVQIDTQRNLFRFIDDNVGICEYPSQEAFAAGLSGLLSTFYHDDMRLFVAMRPACVPPVARPSRSAKERH